MSSTVKVFQVREEQLPEVVRPYFTTLYELMYDKYYMIDLQRMNMNAQFSHFSQLMMMLSSHLLFSGYSYLQILKTIEVPTTTNETN